jgi:predicted RNA binding protein YcfA (HicA-like mRNA interferase family)
MAGSKGQKLLRKVMTGSANVRFGDVVACAEAFGFRLDRVSGSHHIFVHPEVREILNLQNAKGKAKPYQIRQLLDLIERYNLRSNDE